MCPGHSEPLTCKCMQAAVLLLNIFQPTFFRICVRIKIKNFSFLLHWGSMISYGQPIFHSLLVYHYQVMLRQVVQCGQFIIVVSPLYCCVICERALTNIFFHTKQILQTFFSHWGKNHFISLIQLNTNNDVDRRFNNWWIIFQYLQYKISGPPNHHDTRVVRVHIMPLNIKTINEIIS